MKKFRPIISLVVALTCGFVLQVFINAGIINGYYDQIMSKMAMFIIAAVSLNLINGICGQFSSAMPASWLSAYAGNCARIRHYCSARHGGYASLSVS